MNVLSRPWRLLAAAATVLLAGGQAEAQTIRSPTAVASNTGGEVGGASILNTINHSGLSTGFTNGVTNFDTYIAGNPTHTPLFFGNEWFTPTGVNAATIVYDMGALFSIDRLALWNEEFAGIASMGVALSADGVAFTSAGLFAPANSPTGASYPAQVFSLTQTNARFVRLQVTGPQIPNDGYNGISMGEIAFRTFAPAAVDPIPEPISAALLIPGLAAFGLIKRRKRDPEE